MDNTKAGDRKHAVWAVKDKEFCLYECSECKMIIYSESVADRQKFHRFCGRCGSIMSEEVE